MYPVIDLTKVREQLNDEDFSIAQRVVGRGQKLRASKPVGNDYTSRCASYVWRMVAFHTSQNPQHQMFPAAAIYWYLPIVEHDERTVLVEKLNKIVDIIEETIPKTEWRGVLRWGKSLGYL